MLQFEAQSLVVPAGGNFGVLKSTSPAVTTLRGSLYLFYIGVGKDGVWSTVSTDGKTWGATDQLHDTTKGTTSPSAAVLNVNGTETMFVFFVDGADGRIRYQTTTNGTLWRSPQEPGSPNIGIRANTSPNAAVFPVKGTPTLFLFYVGSGGQGIVYKTTTDGKTWTPATVPEIPGPTGLGVLSDTSPHAVAFKESLYLFYTGSGSDGIWFTSTPDGRSWRAVRSVDQLAKHTRSNVLEGTSPSAFVYTYDSSLYILWTASDHTLWLTVWDGADDWAPALSLNVFMPTALKVMDGTSCASCFFNQLPFVFWNGFGNDGFWFTSALSLQAEMRLNEILSAIQAGKMFVVQTGDPRTVERMQEVFGSPTMSGEPVQIQNEGRTGIALEPASASTSKTTDDTSLMAGFFLTPAERYLTAVVLAVGYALWQGYSITSEIDLRNFAIRVQRARGRRRIRWNHSDRT